MFLSSRAAQHTGRRSTGGTWLDFDRFEYLSNWILGCDPLTSIPGPAQSNPLDPTRYGSNLPELFRLIRPLVGEKSDKCGIMAASGEDVAWDEAWEWLWARE